MPLPSSPQLQPLPPQPPEPPEPPEPPVPPEPPHPPVDPPTIPPPPPPPPIYNPECDQPGFTRPAGVVPPGYIFSPTMFTRTVGPGAALDPQPDDTFAADAPGHATHKGKLRTRMSNGREEFLVCAHVGTNTPDDALTPFPTTGPGAHPRTIEPRVVIIDAAGQRSTYQLFGSGLTGSSLRRYADSTDVHEGLVQMWIPFTPSLREPGFTVRVEIRGTAALPNGGSTKVMGADEVFVHLGLAPVARNAVVDQAVGVALDDSVIVERASDPGADDVERYLVPKLRAAIQPAIDKKLPITIDDDFDWAFSPGFIQKAPGTVNSLPFTTTALDMDIVDFNATESRLQFHIAGTARPQLTSAAPFVRARQLHRRVVRRHRLGQGRPQRGDDSRPLP